MSALARNHGLRVGAALALPFVALALQWTLWPWLQPYAWVLFLPTVFFSARLGGRIAGIAATIVSAMMVWYFFVPPQLSLLHSDLSAFVSLGVFIVSGVLFADVQQRLERALERANAARTESESKFQAVVEQSLAGIYIVQDGVLVHVNQFFAEMLGYDSPSEIDGILRAETIGNPNPNGTGFEGSSDGGNFANHGPQRILALHKDGRVLELQLHSRPFELDGRPATIGLAIDVTSEAEAERKLRQEQALLTRMSQIAKIGGWEFDPASKEQQWTDEVALIHDLDPAVGFGDTPMTSFYTPESRPVVERALADAVEFRRSYDVEGEIVSAKGVRKWVRVTGEPVVENDEAVRVHGTMQDVSDRRAAELARGESETRYRSLFDSMNEGIAFCEMFFDGAGAPIDWRYDQINPAFERITGIKDARGKLVSEILPGIDKTNPELFEIYGAVAKTGVPAEFEVFVPVLERGQWLSVSVTRPNADQFAAFFTDITQRKESEAKVLELNATLERRVEQRTAEVVAANQELESFAYAVSHDLRGPLRAMSGFAQALEEDYAGSLDDEARSYIEHITAGSRRMGELIDGLLILSRATRGDLAREIVDVSSMAESILSELRVLNPQRQIDWEIDPGITIDADSRMAAALMRNLLENAWKYTGKTEEAHISVTQSRDAEGVDWTCVADNGAGFDSQFSSQLFKPFHRLHAQDEFAGIGIGLATVKRIVERHGGEITGSGEPGNGARFCFTIPGKVDGQD